MNPDIFKSYDVRGIYKNGLDEKDAYAIGRALVVFLGAKKIAVGRDVRESSPALSEALIDGIANQGADVYDIGLATTPMVYFATNFLKVDGSVSVTASHNTAEWNGFKFSGLNVTPIGKDSGLFEIRDLAVKNKFENPIRKGSIVQKDIKKDYFDYIASFENFGNKKFKIVIDVANAMGVLDLDLFKRFSDNIELTSLYDTLDGKFPNHEANPIKPETLVDLQKKILEEKSDFGAAMDGDADRIAFVDENGKIIPGDILGIILAEEVLKKHPEGTVAFDLRATRSVREIIERLGGKVIDTKVGHSNVKKLMRETGAVFGGELSGHYFFSEKYVAEHGPLPIIMVINLLAKTGKTLSAMVADARKYSNSGEINRKVENVPDILAELKKKYSDGKMKELDGISIDYPEWWFNVRPSNTEPIIRLVVEAQTKEMMEQKRDELLKIIRG